MGDHNQSGRTAGTVLDKRVLIRVSAEDKHLMQRIAAGRGVSVARAAVELFRLAAGAAPEREETDETVEELRRIRGQIWRVGHNINQIARKVNRDVSADRADEASAMHAAHLIDRQLDRVQGIIDQAGQGSRR